MRYPRPGFSVGGTIWGLDFPNFPPPVLRGGREGCGGGLGYTRSQCRDPGFLMDAGSRLFVEPVGVERGRAGVSLREGARRSGL